MSKFSSQFIDDLTSLSLAVLLVPAGVVAGVVGSAGGITSLISYPALLAAGVPPLPANVGNIVAAVATEYLRALADQRWPDDIDAVAADYRDRCDTLGRRVRLALPGDKTIMGTAVDIDADGRIVVEDDHGHRTTAAAGDVTHLRTEN